MSGGLDYNLAPKTLAEFSRVGRDVLVLPFDMAREQYVKLVKAGWVERSLLASARFEKALSAMERFTLGAMARRY
jgi:hypothetical protein